MDEFSEDGVGALLGISDAFQRVFSCLRYLCFFSYFRCLSTSPSMLIFLYTYFRVVAPLLLVALN